MMRGKEDDLALFLEMRKRDKDRRNLLLFDDDDDEDLTSPPLDSKPGSSPLFKIVPTAPTSRRNNVDDFLNFDTDKNDYNWLLTPPGTPLFPHLEKESNKPPIGQIGAQNIRPILLKSRLANPAVVTSSRNSLASRQAASLSSPNSYNVGTRRPSSSGGHSSASRPSTPTGRSTISATSKPSRPSTPTSRVTLPTKPVVQQPRSLTPARSSTVKSSASTFTRSAVPTPAPTISSTPSSARSSTPTSKPYITTPNKPLSRSATPTRRPSAPSSLPSTAAPPVRSSSVTKSGPPISKSLAASKSVPTISKSSAPSRGSSPIVRSRPWKPSDMPGFSHDAPPNLRTSMPERPSSACRGRPGAPSSRSSSVELEQNIRPRRQSCSPSRGRTPNGIVHSGSSVPAVSRLRVNGGDSVSPVQIGSNMVERVVNQRRLAPPKQDDLLSKTNSLTGKSSPDSTGFGRTLSRKSLDMAMRHMDIRRSIPNNLRPLMTNIPASSIYSVRGSGERRSRPVSVSDSPIATSSNASSEQSLNNNIMCLDGSEVEDDLCSDRIYRSSPAGPRPR